MRLASLAVLVYAAMIVEATRARANERAQFARGGLEPQGDVHGVMQVAYPAAFGAMILEGLVRPSPPVPVLVAGAVLFAAGKTLKWWAIAVLGRFWTFRVVVVPGAPLVARGPYRFLRHPNYVGVVGELVGTALLAGAAITGPIAVALFGLLMVKRIHVENQWLAATSKGQASAPYRGT
jgi:methyltransferase